jgi:hypothetical protein
MASEAVSNGSEAQVYLLVFWALAPAVQVISEIAGFGGAIPSSDVLMIPSYRSDNLHGLTLETLGAG